MKKTISIRKIKDIALIAATVLTFLGVLSAAIALFATDKTEGTSLEVQEISATATLNEWLDGATDTKTYVMTESVELATSETNGTVLSITDKHTAVVDGNGNTLTATGAGAGTIRAYKNSTLVLRNLTFVDNTSQGSYGLAFGGNIRFENCVINSSLFFTDNANVTFEDCKITCPKTQKYAVWIVDGDAVFENCTFSGTRALKIHEFGKGNEVSRVGVYNCKFERLTEKVGVVIGDLTVAPKNTYIEVVDSTFNECLAWDNIGSLEGVDGYWESDTITTAFTFIRKNNTVEFTPTTYKIVYRAVHNGKTVTDVHEAFFVNGNAYPTVYWYGVDTKIDDLKEIIYPSPYEDRVFEGWYLDEACTIAFDGVIDAGERGHIVLYAKVDVVEWTPMF